MSIIGGVSNSSIVDTSTQAGQAKESLDEDLNRFLNLLVTQLKNQDPLDPMDANEFTSQLVQFANVEQQIYQNANLEKLVSLQQSTQTGMMVDYLGKSVEVIGDTFSMEEGDETYLSYKLDEKAAATIISIQNEAGVTVFTKEGEIEAGRHEFTWDGKNNNGVQQEAGNYTLVVSPLDGEGEIMDVTTIVSGTVTGAAADDGEAYLYVGEILTPMDQILTVRDPEQGSTSDSTQESEDSSTQESTGTEGS